MPKVSDVITLLSFREPDEEICIAWWTKEEFGEEYNGKDIKDNVWKQIAIEFGDQTQFEQAKIWDIISQFIIDEDGYIDTEEDGG